MLAAREGRLKVCHVISRANVVHQLLTSLNIYFVAHNIATRIAIRHLHRHHVRGVARKPTTKGRNYPAVDYLL